MRRIFINEAQEVLLKDNIKLPSFLTDRLSDEEVFSPLNDGMLAKKLLMKGYKDAVSSFSDDITNIPNDKVINEFNQILSVCIKKEQKFRPQLEQLCYNTIASIFDIPADQIEMELSLVDKINPSYEFHISPNTGGGNTSFIDDEYEYEDFSEIDNEVKETDKRRLINMLVQGIAMKLTEQVRKTYFNEIFELDEELPHLYSKLIKLNDYILFTNDIRIDDNNHYQGGCVRVMLGDDLTVTKIEVAAVTFPMLLTETIKGLMEVVAANGLPDNIELAKNVIDFSDVLQQEPWNMRFGIGLWNMLTQGKKIDTKIVPEFLSIIVKADVDDFIDLMKEVTHNTKKGKTIINDILDSVQYNSKYNAFLDDMLKKHTDKQVIDEEEPYFSDEELYDEENAY